MSYQQKPKYSYDKFDEHRDETPLGKLQQQYWTTKQQVIKKLGKKEDEFVVASDAELDSKLESFESIAESSEELLKIIEAYQDKLINQSIEEAEMSRFLKSQSTFDTKTRAGKMMSAVSKGQHFSSQQRTTLRLPLVRLANEVDTFRVQAIKDTLVTVRKMEQARTEYRGALLWMRNASSELDPDAGGKLEKFRRVQAQVKRTKARFDRLKGDVIQKIDLLAASRCNMFSHALVNYQQALILFWQKTAKTMNAIADAFKGYQYYEFNIIKDLVEPSKKLAKMIKDKEEGEGEAGENESGETGKSTKNDDTESKSTENDEKLIDVSNDNVLAAASAADGSQSQTSQEKTATLSEFGDFVGDVGSMNGQSAINNKEELGRGVDELNELIDLMTLAEETRLSEQMRELEQLEAEKRQRMAPSNTALTATSTKEKEKQVPSTASGLFSFMKKSTTAESTPKQDLFEIMGAAGVGSAASGSQSSSGLGGLANLRSINELFSNANDEFEREWQSVFGGHNAASHPTTTNNNQPPHDGTISPTNTEFSLFSNANEQPSNDLDLFPSGNAADKKPVANSAESKPSQTKQSGNKQNWFDLFAELDPLKNPDAIGKSENLEEERNC